MGNSANVQTALLTGASGFLGRHIGRELARRGWRVIGLDRRDLPPDEQRQCGLSELHVLELPAGDLAERLLAIRPAVIVHAAGPASVPDSLSDPVGDFRGCTLPLLNLLDAVRDRRIEARMVYLSSAAVYGNPSRLPVAEDAPAQPVSPYGFHKWMAERLVVEYGQVYGVRGCCVRIFSAYGAGLRRQVFWDLSRKILAGSVVELLGTHEQTRDFVHAGDVARGVAIIAERAACAGEVYNLAAGTETALGDLARRLAVALDRSVEIVFTGRQRPGDPVRWCADTRRLRQLGYEPQVSLADGVAEYARWVRTAGTETGRYTRQSVCRDGLETRAT